MTPEEVLAIVAAIQAISTGWLHYQVNKNQCGSAQCKVALAKDREQFGLVLDGDRVVAIQPLAANQPRKEAVYGIPEADTPHNVPDSPQGR